MTLKDLVISDLVKDADIFSIARTVSGSAGEIRKRGHWFNNHILDDMDQEIKRFQWDDEDGYVILLKE